jgi:hypothetical protein
MNREMKIFVLNNKDHLPSLYWQCASVKSAYANSNYAPIKLYIYIPRSKCHSMSCRSQARPDIAKVEEPKLQNDI